MGIFDWLSGKRKQSKKEVVEQYKIKDDMPASIDSSFEERKMLKRNMKFDNETIREAVIEWDDNENKSKKKYGHIANWDTSEVTDMNNLFSNGESFNQPIGAWDVSNVTSMHAMFGNAYNFNQPIDNWNVSKVEDMSFMFCSSEGMKFNQPLDNWDVSKVTNMEYMFLSAESFNQPIGSWNVSNVTNMDNMFSKAKSFNQPLDNWDVSKVTNMSGMFYCAELFNQDIGDWDMSRVTDKESMFFSENYEMISKYGINGEKIDSGENNRFLSSWSTQELKGTHNLFKGLIFETYPMTDKKHKSRLGAMIEFFQMAFCSNQDTYSFVDNKAYQNFVKEIQLDEILLSKEGINSLNPDLNKRKKNELLFMVTILITQSDVGWDEVFKTESFNLIRKMLAIEFNEDSYNKMYEIYCEEDDNRHK